MSRTDEELKQERREQLETRRAVVREHENMGLLFGMLEDAFMKWCDDLGIDGAFYDLKVTVRDLDIEFNPLQKYTWSNRQVSGGDDKDDG